MAIDFTLEDDVVAYRDRIVAFVAEELIPLEQDTFRTGLTDDLRRDIQTKARARGLWAPQAAGEYGGGGYDYLQAATLLEAAGYSLLGPLALNCHAPDEGNIHLLTAVATPEQKERYLRPLIGGEWRSCFAMTEPPPGAGSDPAALQTTATRTDGGWVIAGEKTLITGADGAGFSIVMARTGDEAGAATMFLVDADNPGWVVTDHVRTIDSVAVGGHCRVLLDDVAVADDAVLGDVGRAFANAQVRLVPARLTHCMRWLGAAQRAHDIALDRANNRSLFGEPLVHHGMAQQLIADNEIDLAAARALLWHATWQYTTGAKGTEQSSRAKVFVSEATFRIVDRAVQLAGGMGTTDELVIGRIFADIRAFRIYDGASEVHRMSIAKRAARRMAEQQH
ncbi:MAG: acyl-CoA dehydrogenase [Nitriliruptorales bacterium]|nr:acyl-CoA dehydrogenase [Nitriliruptorales bacterium]